MSKSLPEHVLRVKKLYRNILQLNRNWYFSRDEFIQIAKYTRYEFDIRSKFTHPDDIQNSILLGERYMEDNYHPEPYLIPRQEGGSSFQRNAAQEPWLVPRNAHDEDPNDIISPHRVAEFRKKVGLDGGDGHGHH